MSSDRRRDRSDRDDDRGDDAERSRQRQRRDDDRHGGDRRGNFEDRRRHAPPSLASGLKKDRDVDEGLTFETSPGIVAVKSFEKMGLRVSGVDERGREENAGEGREREREH